MNELFDYNNLPDNLWLDLDELATLDDLDILSDLNFSDFNIVFDNNNNLTFERISPTTILLSLKEEEMIKESYTTLTIKNVSENQLLIAKYNFNNDFKSINTQLLATTANRWKLPSGVQIAKTMGTSVKDNNGYNVTARSLFIANNANKSDFNVNKSGLITTDTASIKIDATEEALLRFVHANFSPVRDYGTWRQMLLDLDPNNANHLPLVNSLINWNNSTKLTESEAYALYNSLIVKTNTSNKGVNMALSFAERMKQTALKGAQQGAIGFTNRKFAQTVTDKMGDVCPPWLKSPAGLKALEMLLPALILLIAEYDTTNRIPKKELVKQVATVAFEDASRDGVDQLLTVAMDLVGPWIEEYRTAAEGLSSLESLTETDAQENQALTQMREMAQLSNASLAPARRV